MDAGDDGLFETIKSMGKNNVSVIGAGRNIQEARKPAIIECKGTRVGVLDYCSVMASGHEAGEHRAGVCPIRISTAYQVSTVQPGNPPQRIITKANTNDLSNMVEDIEKLKPNVDVLVVCQHWGIHFVTSPIAEYEYEVGHAAIDAGADIIIGTHAHTLKGIEVYKGKVILHCLGNFAFDHVLAGRTSVPGWTTVDSHSYTRGFARWKIDPDYPTHAFPVDCHNSILLKCDIVNKKIQRVAFIPCRITRKGISEPLPSSDPRSDEVLHYIEWLCEDQRIYDTEFRREGDEIVVVT
jgi:poly-gamma-glutamate synthesis protein (capsule biosynthesis protein)